MNNIIYIFDIYTGGSPPSLLSLRGAAVAMRKRPKDAYEEALGKQNIPLIRDELIIFV